MLVGFMDRTKKPTKIAKTTALMASYYGIELIYFRTCDIDREKGIVKGKIYTNNKWKSVKRELPTIIDISSRCFVRETREIISYLRKNAILTFDNKNKPNKNTLQKELEKDSDFAQLVIPTKPLDSFKTLEVFLDKYSSIIIKPLSGKKGIGLYSLSKKSDFYLLSYKKRQEEITRDDLYELYKNYLLKEKYILQKQIESRTENGDPFDCRIVVQKNGTGKWVIGKTFFRIGLGQKVVSNTSHGGVICEPKPFLKKHFGDQWEGIYQELKDVGIALSYKIEEIKKTPTMDLGLDIGIDPKGNLYIFEANNGASLDLLISESAMYRLGYYHYIFNKQYPELINKNNENKEQTTVSQLRKKLKQIRDHNRNLIHERDKNAKEFNQIVLSKSWRFTSPIRKIKSLFK